MSEAQETAGQYVKDEDNVVDQQLKSRIVTVRQRVDQREDMLFVQAALKGGIDQETQLRAWGTTVRQYLRAIRPLLTGADLRNSERYWSEIDLGQMTVYPPSDEVDWQAFHSSGNPHRLRRQLGLPPDFEPPRPKVVQFKGLKRVLQNPTVECHWSLGRSVDHSKLSQSELHVQRPPSKEIYEAAICQADEFLQQAGVGLEIGFKEVNEQETEVF